MGVKGKCGERGHTGCNVIISGTQRRARSRPSMRRRRPGKVRRQRFSVPEGYERLYSEAVAAHFVRMSWPAVVMAGFSRATPHEGVRGSISQFGVRFTVLATRP